jgi:SAM-dependent methyltransferase
MTQSFEARSPESGVSPANSDDTSVVSRRGDGLDEAWRHYYRRSGEAPPHPAAREFLNADIADALRRLIPADVNVLEVGSGTGKLLAALPNRERVGIDYLPERVADAARNHPDIPFHVADATALAEARALTDSAGNPARFSAIVCDRLCHSVLDIKRLLESMRGRLAEGGRIYLTVFNYLWELPTLVAERAGWKHPAPTMNWLSDYDLKNLFEIVGLEAVRFEDRVLVPLEIPGSSVVNRYVARLPVVQRLSLYRVYVLRAQSAGRQSQPSVSIVVPTRNEAGNVQAAIDRTPQLGSFTELIFVEGGSSDGTWDTIQQAIARYDGPLRLSAYQQTGKGKGDAVRLGFSKATGDLLMILDADLTVPPEDMPNFYEVAVRGQADYVQGTRLVYPMEKEAMRFFNKIGNVAFSRLFTYLLQQPIRDTLCGTKVMWRTDYERLAAAREYFGDFDPFGDFDLIFGAAKLNLKISEIPIRYRERTYGQTNISRWKHGVLLLKMSLVAAKKLRFV